MKRTELLKQKQDEKNVINIERIIEKDKRFLKKEKFNIEDELATNTEAIEDFLKNPNLNVNDQFLLLLEKQDELKTRLKIIEKAEENL